MSAWEVLGLKVDAPEEDIRRAYRRLSALHHPDTNPGDPSAHDRFIAITSAYRELTRPAPPPLPVVIATEIPFHGFTLHVIALEGYVRCEVVGQRGASYPILSTSRRSLLGEFDRGRLFRAPKGYVGPRDFLVFRESVAAVLGDVRILAMPAMRLEHPTIAYIIGPVHKRFWILKRVRGVLHAVDEKHRRVALGGFRAFTDAEGVLMTLGPRHFPPFELHIAAEEIDPADHP